MARINRKSSSEPAEQAAGTQEPATATHLDAESSKVVAGAEPEQTARKPFANPYRAIMTNPVKGFELGENRQFNQLVFTFKDNPGAEVTGKLKEAGFIYRAAEKAWTLQASPTARELAWKVATELRGPATDIER